MSGNEAGCEPGRRPVCLGPPHAQMPRSHRWGFCGKLREALCHSTHDRHRNSLVGHASADPAALSNAMRAGSCMPCGDRECMHRTLDIHTSDMSAEMARDTKSTKRKHTCFIPFHRAHGSVTECRRAPRPRHPGEPFRTRGGPAIRAFAPTSAATPAEPLGVEPTMARSHGHARMSRNRVGQTLSTPAKAQAACLGPPVLSPPMASCSWSICNSIRCGADNA